MATRYVSLASSMASQAGSTLLGVVVVVGGFVAILAIVFVVAGRVTGRLEKPIAVVICLGPALFLVSLGLIIPAITTINNSLKNQQFLGQLGTKYIGLKNYTYAFTDPYTQHTIVRTLLWLLVVPAAAVFVGLLVALLVDRMRFSSIPKTMVFLPTAISFVGAAVIWSYVYNYVDPSGPQTGLLSQIAIKLGWSNPPNWLITVPLNTFLEMVIMIWIQTGFAMVILSAALRGIPEETLEAARIDGANDFRIFFDIMIPQIWGTLVVVWTTITITVLKVFDIVYAMTNGEFQTQVLANLMYRWMFISGDYGRGSTIAVIIMLAVVPIMVWNIRRANAEVGTR